MIMALAPVFAWLWLWLNRRGREPSTIVKFASGLVLVGASFFVFLAPLSIAEGGHRTAAMWLVGIYFVQTVGELTLSPVGLSVTTKMAPKKYASQMMGVWFLAVTAGDSVTALLSNPAVGGVSLDRMGFVGLEAALAVVAGVAVWMYRGKVKKLMGNVNWASRLIREGRRIRTDAAALACESFRALACGSFRARFRPASASFASAAPVKSAAPSRIAVPATRPRAFSVPWSPAPVSARPPEPEVPVPPDAAEPPEVEVPPDAEVPPAAPPGCSVVSRRSETAVFVGVHVVVVPSALTVSTPGDSVEVPLAPGV